MGDGGASLPDIYDKLSRRHQQETDPQAGQQTRHHVVERPADPHADEQARRDEHPAYIPALLELIFLFAHLVYLLKIGGVSIAQGAGVLTSPRGWRIKVLP